jgi:hypothetical protein
MYNAFNTSLGMSCLDPINYLIKSSIFYHAFHVALAYPATVSTQWPEDRLLLIPATSLKTITNGRLHTHQEKSHTQI